MRSGARSAWAAASCRDERQSHEQGADVTTLDAVSAYVPTTSVPIEAVMDPHGLDPTQTRVFRRFYGLDSVRVDPSAGLAEILLSAARKLTALRGREHLVRYVIAARSMPHATPEPLNALPGICR